MAKEVQALIAMENYIPEVTSAEILDRILNLFVHFGADENILYEAHPHIGTNKLPHIITEMRKRIIECGGEFHFNKKVIDFKIENDKIKAVKTERWRFI